MRNILHSKRDAYSLLKELGANDRLIVHLQLVGEAAEILIGKCNNLSIPFDSRLVELGVAVHDAGKIKYPGELDGPGSRHEPEGERLLLANGVEPRIARCCLSHARFNEMEVSFEELLVALADKLWKGKRASELELQVIDRAAALLGKHRWELFTELDSTFEEIASGGIDRLNRSK